MTESGNRVVLTDIDVPFWRIVAILIKWTIAAIPALIIVWLTVMLVWMAIAAVFGLAMHGPGMWGAWRY